jgi:hypothetical protein
MKGLGALFAMLGIALISHASIMRSDSWSPVPLNQTKPRLGDGSLPIRVSGACNDQIQSHFKLPENAFLSLLNKKISCP